MEFDVKTSLYKTKKPPSWRLLTVINIDKNDGFQIFSVRFPVITPG